MVNLKINKAELVKNKYGKNDIKITMLSLYDNGKFVKHVKLNDFALDKILKAKIEIELTEDELKRVYKSLEK